MSAENKEVTPKSEGAHYSVKTPLLPHQKRVINKLKASGGVAVLHGLGAGKSLSSIAAASKLGLPVDAIVPASLVNNYLSEIEKHTGGLKNFPELRLRSYQSASRAGNGAIDPERLAVLDEAHKTRSLNTTLNRLAHEAGGAKARLLLSGTPTYNAPENLAVILNAARGDRALPEEPGKFRKEFVRHREVSPGFLMKLLGVKGGQVAQLKNREKLIDLATGYVDTHPSGGENFPSRKDTDIDVPMGEKQREIYKFHEGSLPWLLKMKVRAGLPLPKAEAAQLNAFAGGLRQTSNTARPYVEGMTDAEENENATKLRRAVEELVKAKKANPKHRAVAYSNYLESGLLPYQRMLREKGLSSEIYHGGLTSSAKKALVDKYNKGLMDALLLSSSGGEGLSLKNTGTVQVLEPHWNKSKIEQVIGRALRYGSHSELPENQRKVNVQHFYATQPESFWQRLGIKPDTTIDKYLQERSNEKDEITKQIMDALTEASKRGPLRHH